MVFYGLRRFSLKDASVASLMLASLVFYAYWRPSDTFILIGTIFVNFFVAKHLGRLPQNRSRLLLMFGVAVNLGLLVYFKYFDFLAANVAAVGGFRYTARHIIMPIGISFFTFTQIAYLVDCYKSRTYEPNLITYALFVTIFPHLIAGPIIHHSQMRPQFAQLRRQPVESDFILMGVVIFVAGFAKKVLLADNVVIGADLAFNAADHGAALSTGMAWMGTVAYTLQIYFDFSGYSDMAIGLALLFGLRLPVNFNSPYKSVSIIDFWRRWHITLSNWLRDYLYIPLGGNRGGEFARLRNVFITFLLGGLWHGAGWTFVIWGALHGTYVVINHLMIKFLRPAATPRPLVIVAKRMAVLLLVMIAWVFFRATTVGGAVSILRSMFTLQSGGTSEQLDAGVYFWIVLGAAIALFGPSTQQLTRYTPKLSEPLRLPAEPLLVSLRGGAPALAASPAVALITGLIFALGLTCIWRPAIFIYFNF
ncbi:MAG TPA: MBOAT family protein [Steroidobacteraceae bacterium]|jgi:D-alanyl-lipoteichoic acid acyltransferase DltB (MBOAT superfamily)|nr:MBOAT family protein [Steroidobacteraceae bacterium]